MNTRLAVLTSVAVASLVSVASSARQESVRLNPPAGRDWPTYYGDKARTHFSTLTQIDKSNVGGLQVAWTFDTGEAGSYQTNPLVVDGVLYTRSPAANVIALNAATGVEMWRFDPASERPPSGPTIAGSNVARGLVFWDGGADGRRLYASARNYLYCLDAVTGRPIRTFGEDGSIHLGRDLDIPDGGPTPPPMLLNTPGVIYKDMLIIGSNPGEAASGPPGHIRAYDVRTGARRWIFHTIPHPGEFGYETWPPEYYKTGASANNWAGLALDEARGIVYVPTGSPGGDFWGGNRWGQNLFANSLVALDASTGRRLWHFQFVHHDVWDRDLPTPPLLMTVTNNGRRVDVVVQGTKTGQLFVFDRVTGQPLWPIEERPVPQSTIPAVRTWPTQPFPTRPAPLTRGPLTEADATTLTPQDHAAALLRLRLAPDTGPYPAPSTKDATFFPGFDGGMNWGGGAADPQGIFYINVTELPWGYQMVPTTRDEGVPVSLGERTYMIQCGACHGMDRRGELGSGIPALTGLSTRHTKVAVAQIVEQGTGGRMPAFSQLPEGPRRAMIDFLFGDEQPAAAYPAAPGRAGGAGGGQPAGPPPPYAFRGFQRWLDSQGYPAITPPWGLLYAVNLNTGDVKWKVPLGEFPELTARGIPPTGTENYGGPVVTASGLLFIAATADETIRAFDTDTGKVLWKARLPFSGTATPSIYSVNGRQFLVVSAGGGKSRRPSGGMVVAFSLPERVSR